MARLVYGEGTANGDVMRHFFRRCNWSHAENDGLQETTGGRASAEQVREIFESQQQDLGDLALFLTGRADLAEACLLDASAPGTHGTAVFLEWLQGWARYATIKSAIRLLHSEIKQAARNYEGQNSQQRHTVTSAEIAEALRKKRIEADRLDALARFALVLRGVERHPLSESALLLEVAATPVEAAYCAALQLLGLELPVGQPHVAVGSGTSESG